MLYSILVTIDVLLAIGIIGLVLIQQGKGADIGAAFGGGASGTVFGARGSASFLTRVTTILAMLFFVNSLALAYLASHRPADESVIHTTQEPIAVMPDVESIQDLPQVNVGEVDSLEPLETEAGAIPDDVPE